MNLEELRRQIDLCNNELLQVLKKRFDLTKQVGIIKAKEGLMSLDSNREKIVIENMQNLAIEYGLNKDMIKELFIIIMDQAKKEHEDIKNK